jgi:predicted RNA-binding protein with TRAM domain
VIFVKGGYIREKIKIMITETGSRFAIARTA